jgi:hypothetical protein
VRKRYFRHCDFWYQCWTVILSTSITIIIKTTSFTPPSVIKLYLYVCIRLYMIRFLANHLQKAYQHCKGNYHYMIYKYIKLVPTDFLYTFWPVQKRNNLWELIWCICVSCNGSFLYNVDKPSEDGLLRTETCKGINKHINIIWSHWAEWMRLF